MEPFLLILLGILGGLIAGLMGVGGGIIFTPVLYFLFDHAGIEDPVQWSVASGLLCTFVTAGTSTFRQVLNKNLYLKEGLLLGVLGIIGISLGRLILTSGYYQREQFAVFFSLVLFYAAFMMFRKGSSNKSELLPEETHLGPKCAFVTGGVGGFIASLAGVGGGGVMVPIMNIGFKIPFVKAVSVSHLGMTLMLGAALIQLAIIPVESTAISPYTIGYIDVGAALPLSVGGLFGAYAGTYLNPKIPRRFLQWGFAVLSVVMGGRLMLTVF
jgi:uncharacterized membrane protein YfcA